MIWAIVVIAFLSAFVLGMCICIYLCAYLLSDCRHYLRCIRDDLRKIVGDNVESDK